MQINNGCYNITLFIPKLNKTELICNNYSCNLLNIHSFSNVVTNDINFNLKNCECSDLFNNQCLNLYCNFKK